MDGTTLKFSESDYGRDEGLPKMTSLLEALVNESSFSLLPKNFESALYFKMDELREYLVQLSSRL